MKSTLLTLIVGCLFLSACNNQSQTDTQQTTAETPKNTNASAVTEQPAVAPTQASEPQVDERLKAGKDIYDKRCKTQKSLQTRARARAFFAQLRERLRADAKQSKSLFSALHAS